GAGARAACVHSLALASGCNPPDPPRPADAPGRIDTADPDRARHFPPGPCRLAGARETRVAADAGAGGGQTGAHYACASSSTIAAAAARASGAAMIGRPTTM